MILYPASLKAVGAARTGIAPANLLDIQTLDDGIFFWADRKIVAPPAILQQAPNATPAPTPPVALTANQQVAWAFPTAVSVIYPLENPPHGTASATLTSGDFYLDLGSSSAGAMWSGFQMPPIPPGAVIDAIYPVIYINGSGSGANNLVVGGGATLANLPVTGSFTAQFSGPSIGTTSAALAGASLGVEVGSSQDDVGCAQTMTVSSIAFAVYYSGGSGGGAWSYEPWLLSVPSFAFHRSLQTDIGSFVVQNVSGDTLSRDVEKLLRASAFEGAFFIYRLWQPGAEAAWLEVHGTLTVGDVGVDTMTLKAAQLLNPSQDDTPLEIYCETCQLVWGQARCGSTQPTECQYSFQTCQVVERIMVVLNDYEKNYGETQANTALNVINRRRRI